MKMIAVFRQGRSSNTLSQFCVSGFEASAFLLRRLASHANLGEEQRQTGLKDWISRSVQEGVEFQLKALIFRSKNEAIRIRQIVSKVPTLRSKKIWEILTTWKRKGDHILSHH